jgi:hypothetical protein
MIHLKRETIWEDRLDWDLVGQTSRYEIRKLPPKLTWVKDGQYIMSYLLFNTEQERCEVALPSMAAALNSIIQLESQMEALMEAIQATSPVPNVSQNPFNPNVH